MEELKLHKNELKYLKECVYSSVLLEHESELGNCILKKIDKALSTANVGNYGGAIPYDSLSDSFKKSIDSIEDSLNR